MSAPRRPTGRGAAAGTSGLLLAAVLLYALNLRSPITALAPVVRDVERDLGLSSAQAGLLTGLPVLCFALFSPVASSLISRWGVERIISASLGVILAGTLLRSAGGFGTAIAGTALIGLAITAGNIAVPVVVARDFASDATRVTGLYTAALNGGSVLTTALTAPLADAIGWRWALVVWAVFVPLAWFPWRRAVARRVAEPPLPLVGPDATEEVHALRRPLTWLLIAMFAGQSFGYYGVTAWLPSILSDSLHLGTGSAGGGSALFQLGGVLGAVSVPVAVRRGARLRSVFVVIAAGWLLLPIGLLVAPAVWPLWVLLAGCAQGGNFTVVFATVAQRSATVREARRTSTAVQTLGYVAAAVAPSVLGAVHGATDGWTAPLVVILAVLGVMTVAGLTATGARSARPAPS
jgi:CP family cyanate transporter-like MFS transporter